MVSEQGPIQEEHFFRVIFDAPLFKERIHLVCHLVTLFQDIYQDSKSIVGLAETEPVKFLQNTSKVSDSGRSNAIANERVSGWHPDL